MNSDQRQQQEISGLEQWLGGKLPAEETTNLEHLKLRVRIELGETWLQKHVDPGGDPIHPQLPEDVRRAAASAGAPPVATHKFGGKPWAIAGAALGMAAVLTLSVVQFETGGGRTSDANTMAASEDEWLDELDEPLDDVLDEIDEELDELSESLVLSDDLEWDDATDF